LTFNLVGIIIFAKESIMPLVLIESPNKISKLRKILGNNYTIMASVGHIMDLSKKNMGIDLNTFEATYKVNSDKKSVVKEIKKEASNHEVIYIATDPDREGEAIAFHIAKQLPKRGKTIHRVRFNSITKDAVKDAIKNPETLDDDLYNAQQARRMTDRLVGFRVSPVMWNKGLKGTSAGRVQSVALRLISEKEKDIRAFVPVEYWDISVDTDLDFSVDFWGENGKSLKVKNKAEADKIVNTMNNNKVDLIVSEHSNKKRTRKPAPPFITSTLQQAASNSFGWGAKKTMSVAQSIFSQGLITYHRTDSIRVDPQKITDVRTRVENAHGKKYLSPAVIQYGPKGGSQDAHEAIRPTYDSPVSPLSKDEKRLLELVDSRFQASQMASAEFDQVAVKMEHRSGGTIYNFKKNGSTMIFDGFLKVYGEIKDDVILPAMTVGMNVAWTKVSPSQHFTKPPARFSDASIIKLLEKEGVGRPSTYASILDTLLDRKYVKREKKSLGATEIGIMVSDYLFANFPSIVDTGFTSDMESKLDKIAEGKESILNVLASFNGGLSGQIDTALASGLPNTFITEHKCSKCESEMVKKISKHGAFLGCISWPECDGTASIDGTVKESDAVETGHKCPKCSNILINRSGRNGKFYGCKSYPTCKFTAAIGEDGEVIVSSKPEPKKTGVSCQKCKDGEMLERTGKFGKFYGCSKFPKCRNILKSI
jgi:DNA topoisomerase-1